MKTEAPREATPRPWRASEWSDVVGAAVTAQPDPTKNTLLVASIRYSKADADLIVHAVNAHHALVEALRDLIYQCTPDTTSESEDGYPMGVRSPSRDGLNRARRALASLTDEPGGTDG
jgi:hypothetical protein